MENEEDQICTGYSLKPFGRRNLPFANDSNPAVEGCETFDADTIRKEAFVFSLANVLYCC